MPRMTAPPVASLYDFIVGLHIIAVLVAFGWTMGLPVVFSIAARSDPRSLPMLHRFEVRASRLLLNPALVVVLLAGLYLAGKGHHWSEFFVQWGLAAVLIIGGVVGAVMIPLSKRAAEAAERDLEGYAGGEFQPGAEYRELARRITRIGIALTLLVLVTIVLMATNA
jgi:uncharacterized membrane protein